jgi:hypothetical protein
MKQWVGNAHGDQSVRCLREKRVGRFDIRGGWKTIEPGHARFDRNSIAGV